MDEGMVLDIFKQAINNILLFSAPMLLGALIVGLAVAVFQATTQIQEQTLAFVPKILTIFIVLIFVGPWMLQGMQDFFYVIFDYMDLVTLQ